MNLHLGRFAVGALDVDARTGASLDPAQRVAAIQARAAELASACPPTPQIRNDQGFVYHNGAESYYAARGFRDRLKV